MGRLMLRWFGRGALLCLGLSVACAHPGRFTWVDDYNQVEHPETYLILPGDLLSVRVLGQEELSTRARVQPDGHISLPFINDVKAAGETPAALGASLQRKLKRYVRNAVASVTVEESQPLTISVTGEVMRPGLYPLEPRAGVLQALASAGGLSQFAYEDRIFVLRRPPAGEPPLRIRFRYDMLARAEGRGASFVLRRGDIVVVE